MRLEEYWGVGPKTRDRLVDKLGTERAIQAIERGDVRELTDAGLARGRATRILRRATGGPGVDTLATPDARTAYKEVLELAARHALTERAADRIRILTPLATRDEMDARLDEVLAARDAWQRLDDDSRERVISAYERYDEHGESVRAAITTAITLRDTGVETGPFEPVSDLETEVLVSAADALDATADGRVRSSADDELERLRTALDAVSDLESNALTVIEELRSDGVRDVADFREAFERHLLGATTLDGERIREAMPGDATDATDFVTQTLRSLRTSLAEAVDEREAAVETAVTDTVSETRDDVDRAVEIVDDIALSLSLARFALAYDCRRPTYAAGSEAALAMVEARNLTLEAANDSVQPVTYALGAHGLESAPDDAGVPGDERVTVLTGANSGGKTTLLETCFQVVLLASMGLPVPAAHATVTPVDTLVFHRRHASFNAGVLEATLRSVVPPLAERGRTLMLVDEFEAITEPGSAADLLHGLVRLTVDRDALGVFVTHLAEDLEPLPAAARVDGIFAEGLDDDLDLVVDYQPRFDTVGRSTPEFIVSRLVANAGDRTERAGFETIAEALGQEVTQQSLTDACDVAASQD